MIQEYDKNAIEKACIETVRLTNETCFKWLITRPENYLGEQFIKSLFLHNFKNEVKIDSCYYKRLKKHLSIESVNSFISNINFKPIDGFWSDEFKELLNIIDNIFKSINYKSLIPAEVFLNKKVDFQMKLNSEGNIVSITKYPPEIINFNTINQIKF